MLTIGRSKRALVALLAVVLGGTQFVAPGGDPHSGG
jgi:hypothetical protein